MTLPVIVFMSLSMLFPCTPLSSPLPEPVSGIHENINEYSEETVLLKEDIVSYTEDTITGEEAGEGEETGLDIRYLLFLQEFRNNINDALTPFMEFVSNFSTRYLILIVMFIYWAVSKRNGLYAIASMCLTLGINQVVKLTACVYRPWIRDARIVPAGDSIITATGYSFPSGHTATAAPLFGGMAVTSDRRNRWIPILCVLGIMLVGFSRNYLGVHTPQDVFVAICESVLCLIIMSKLFAYIEAHPEKEDLFLLAGIIAGFAAIAYITFKPYPMTYVDGKLLVDPQKMMNDGYGDIAFLIAFCIGRFIERRWIRFEPTGINTKGIILCGIGMIIFVLLDGNIGGPLDAMLGSHWGHFARRMITVLYYTALYPLIISLTMKHFSSSAKADSEEEQNHSSSN